jgi:signal transduction histidine kinase/ligand-binding sensor domain-containing protein
MRHMLQEGRVRDLSHFVIRVIGQGRVRRLLAAACALQLSASAAFAEPRLLDEYVVTSWSDEEGLFGGWIVGLAQDRHGYLWIGTVSGLLRFDGLTFERFNGTEQTKLPRRSVSAVYGAKDGSVWVGFSGGGGIYRIQDERIREYGVAEGLGEGRTSAFVEDVDGALLAATADGLYKLVNDRWHLIGESDGLDDGQVHTVVRDRQGAIWVSTSGGVYRRVSREQKFRPVGRLDDPPFGLSESASGEMWATHRTRGFERLDDESDEPAGSDTRYGNGYRLLHDREGNLWVATLGQGVWFLRRGTTDPQVITTSNGLLNDTVRSLFEDRNGDVWVGTTVGLHRFARRRVAPLTDLGVVYAVEAGRRGDVWVGTSSGLVRFSGSSRRRYTTADGLPNDSIRALFVDARERLWISTQGGVAVFDGERFRTLPLVEGQWPPVGASMIVLDRAGDLWLCTEDHGLFRWRAGSLTQVTPSIHGEPVTVHAVTTDRTGQLLLLLAGGGIGKLSAEGSFSLLRASDKFHRSDLAAHQDDAGTVWLGSGERLTRYKDGEVSALTTANGLPSDAIRALVTDRDGHLWVGTSGGIIRIDRHEADKAFADPQRRIEFRSYNSSDGLPGAPIRGGFPNAVRSADGRLWFVTGNGVTVVDPQRLSATRPPVPVRIERVYANGRSFRPTGPFTLPPRTTSLQIDYTALEFFSPRQATFRYRLEGLSDEWTDAGPRRQAMFTNLAPGEYTFRVAVRSSEGVWSELDDSIAFSITPMFYQTRWFQAACTIALAGIVALIVYARRQQVRRRFELILAERARMARELHDTLLQSLAGLELQLDTMARQLDGTAGPVKQQLERVRREIQADVSEARQSIWGLRSPTLESRDLATALRHIGGSLAAANHVQFEFVVTGTPTRVAAKVEEHLLRVGREALSNAMRHAQAQTVRLELCYTSDAVILRVSDDGRGFTVTDATAIGETHWGLATMRERAAAIGGRLNLASTPGLGTNIEMIAPLSGPRS